MGIFSKPEIIIFKESNSAEEHLTKLEELLPRATGKVKENIQKEIILTKAGIDGEKKVLYELKNSNMDLVVLQDICIRAKDGREAQIDFVIVTSKLMILLECKNLVGNIEIDSKGNFIRTIQYGKRYWKAFILRLLRTSVIWDAKTVVAESVAGEQKVMTQIEEEPAMMNPTILEEVQMEIPATTGKIICPVCGGELVLRTARHGANTGKQFYGCSSFPRCRYILNIAENLEKSDTSHSKK